MILGGTRSRLVVLAALSLVAGCLGSRGGASPVVLEPSPEPYERDIPLPVGFRLADQSSEDWSNGPIRYLRHRYLGSAEPYAIRTFYREQMPLVRWTPISDRLADGRISMRFEREAEVCTITIERDRPRLGRRVGVEVVVTPKTR